MKLNIGCGNDYWGGWTNLDKEGIIPADIYHDLEEPLPFQSESCSAINSSHVFEHVHNFIPLMNECHRILRPGGLLTIRVPWITGHWGCGDPSHVRFFNHLTFNHWCEWYDQALHFNNGCRFEKVSVKFEENVNWDKDPFLAKAGIAAIEEMKIVLKKV